MTVYLRFSDLQERGLVQSWAQLRRMEEYGFPPGKMLSPNVRIWSEDEIETYLASCPVRGDQPLKGGARTRRERFLAKIKETAA